MFIKYLEIKNFKNITHVILEDNKKVILIEGNNGNGKSSILQALGYVLTDELEDKISSFVRWGQKKFEIICKFSHNGIDYHLEIEGDKGAKKHLTFNDEEYFNSEATQKLREIIDFDLTKYSAISEQGKATQLLFQKKTERLNTLTKILKIDSINESTEKVKDEIRQIKEEIKILEAEIKTYENMTYDFMPEFELPEIEKVKTDLLLLESEKSLFDAEVAKDKEQIKEFEKTISDYRVTCEKEKSSIISDLKSNLTSLMKEKESIEKNQKALKDAQASLDTVDKDIKEQEESIASYAEKLIEPTKPESKDEDEKKLNSQIQEYKFKISSLTKEISDINNRKCPYNFDCDKLKEVSVESYELELEKVKKDLEDTTKLYDKISSELKEYTQKLRVFETYKQKNELGKQALASLEEKKTLLQESIKNIPVMNADELDTKMKDLSFQILQKENEIQEKYNVLIKEVESKITLLSTVKVFPKEKEYADLKNEIVLYDGKVLELERIRKFNKEAQEKKSKNERIILTKKKQYDEKNKDTTLLEEVKDSYKDFSAYLINKGAEHIKNRMNSIFQKGYGRYEITFEHDKSGIDFFYKETGSDILNNVVMASGQEKAVLAMANRLALCSLQNLGILVVDEIDSNASDENSLKLYETILGEKGFNQIWVITHCTPTKEYLENLNNTSVYEIEMGGIKK